MKMQKYKGLLVASILLLSAGCTSIPKSLQTSNEALLVNYSEAKSNANANIGLQARWGGIIAKVENKNNKTMIEVVNLELASSSRPKDKQETLGRFRLYSPGLLDPLIYKQGKSITAIGVISSSENGKIGEQEYQFPVLTVESADNVHLWKKIERVDVRVTHQPLWYMPPYYSYPYPRSNRVIVTKPVVTKSKNKKHSTK